MKKPCAAKNTAELAVNSAVFFAFYLFILFVY
jgi:hypothetical protein